MWANNTELGTKVVYALIQESDYTTSNSTRVATMAQTVFSTAPYKDKEARACYTTLHRSAQASPSALLHTQLCNSVLPLFLFWGREKKASENTHPHTGEHYYFQRRQLFVFQQQNIFAEIFLSCTKKWSQPTKIPRKKFRGYINFC